MIYFDNASSKLCDYSLLLESLSNTVYNKIVYSNPHSLNHYSQNTANKIAECREKVLKFVNASPEVYECVFTSGTTHGLKMVAECFNWTPDNKFIYTLDNHTSVVGMREYALKAGATVEVIDFANNEENDLIVVSSFFDTQAKMDNRKEDHNQVIADLFVMPAESNFSGKLYDRGLVMKQRNKNKNRNTIFLYDVAKYITTNDLDMSDEVIDIAPMSFYKIFGFPTGLGALIIKKSVLPYLKKTYYGGGTVLINSPYTNFHIKKPELHELLEDGSPNYLSIIQLVAILSNEKHQREKLRENHYSVKLLTLYFYDRAKTLMYENGAKVFELYDVDLSYTMTSFNHGSIITFNLLKHDGTYIGYKEIELLLNINEIAVRTGCLCNNGACMKNLGMTAENLRENLSKGHNCAKTIDIIDGKPTGAIRCSFSADNTYKEIDEFFQLLYESYIADAYDSEEKNTINTIKISNLVVYPIKSCGLFEPKSWELTDKGLKYDREWCLVKTATNKIMGQKTYPQLAKVKCRIDLALLILIVKIDEEGIYIELDTNKCNCIDKENSIGYVYDDKINKWFSDRLNVDCKLVRQNTSNAMKNDQPLSFANQGQYLVVTKNSIEDVNERGKFNYNYRRYRPNIVIEYSSDLKPYDEDKWTCLKRIVKGREGEEGDEEGDLILDFFDRCTRCGMVNIAQDEDDLKDERNLREAEPLLTLSRYRREKTNIYMGILMYHSNKIHKNKISIGDVFRIE